MDLNLVDSDRVIQGATEQDILACVESEGCAVLKSDSETYVQYMRVEPPDGYVLEYQQGSLREHYEVADGLVTRDQVRSAFLKFLRGDPSLQTDFRWEKDDSLLPPQQVPEQPAPIPPVPAGPPVTSPRAGWFRYLFWTAFLGIAVLAVYREAFLLVAVLILFLGLTIHEGGHLLAAKLVGIPIKRFRLGLGPRLCHFTWGSTQYELHLFLVLGFVEEAGPPPASELVSRPRRLVYYCGGVVCNFLATVFLFWVGLLFFDRREEAEGSPGRAALIATQRATEVSWFIIQLLPQALLNSLNPGDLNEGGSLTNLSRLMSPQVDSSPSPPEVSDPPAASNPQTKPPQVNSAPAPAPAPASSPPPSFQPGFWMSFCLLLGLFNLVMCCLNLFPIPPLDGYRGLRVLVEMILRRNLSDRYLWPLLLLGFLLVFLLLLTEIYRMIRDLIVTAFS
jgi:Zn-dependent protease